jgi:hypothetical protein
MLSIIYDKYTYIMSFLFDICKNLILFSCEPDSCSIQMATPCLNNVTGKPQLQQRQG